MKLGILGTGQIVHTLMKCMDKLPLEAVYVLGTEHHRQKAEDLVTEYGLDGAFFDYDLLLDSGIDTVYVALPNFLHYEFAKKAIQHGKNAIVEKPITANAGELRDLMALAEQAQVQLIEAVNLHYLPAYQELKAALPAIGRTRIVSMNYSQYSSRYDALRRGEILPAFDPQKAGGALMDLNVYNLHALVGLFGRPEEAHYTANVERGIDTSGILTLRYPDFSAVCVGAKDCRAPVMCTIQGDGGALCVDTPVNQMTAFRRIDNSGEEYPFAVEEPQHRLCYEFMEFIRMCDGQDTARVKQMLEISLAVSEVMERARKEEGVVFANDR